MRGEESLGQAGGRLGDVPVTGLPRANDWKVPILSSTGDSQVRKSGILTEELESAQRNNARPDTTPVLYR
ncbi:hypothetical protein GCM10027590_61250 [Nocardiopsis nanhaiensis]